MGRLLRVGFDLHLTNFGHTCWMQSGRQKTTIKEDDPASEAPLYSLDVDVLPPLGAFGDGNSRVGARVAPVAAAECEQLEEGSKVEMAGLVQDVGPNGQKCICLGRAVDVDRWLVALLGGKRVNVKMSIIKPSGDLDSEVVKREATLAIPLKGPDDPSSRAMIEARDLTHVLAAPWCELCLQAPGKSDWHTGVKYDSEIPCVQMNFQVISGVGVWRTEAQARGAVLSTVDMDAGHVCVQTVTGKNPDHFYGESDCRHRDTQLTPPPAQFSTWLILPVVRWLSHQCTLC